MLPQALCRPNSAIDRAAKIVYIDKQTPIIVFDRLFIKEMPWAKRPKIK